MLLLPRLALALAFVVMPAHAQEPRRGEPEARQAKCEWPRVQHADKCVSLRDAPEAEVRAVLVALSIASYGGSCPCPYFSDRGGRRCGARSAYARAGGATVKCYPIDVTADEVKAARRVPRDST